jgi:hypothetical protein
MGKIRKCLLPSCGEESVRRNGRESVARSLIPQAPSEVWLVLSTCPRKTWVRRQGFWVDWPHGFLFPPVNSRSRTFDPDRRDFKDS